jgi:PiT family inorganic phosphate transporter
MDAVGDLARLCPEDAFWSALAAAITMTILTFLALPASASQAIVGAVMGVGLVSGSADFSALYRILSCWVFTPIAAIVLGAVLYRVLGYAVQAMVRSIPQRDLLFTAGVVFAGCYGAYTLGSNNVANVTGVYVAAGVLSPENASFLGGVSIAGGVLTYSRKVMLTVGKGIVPLDPFSALVAVLAEALTLHLFTQIGVPVSSSQAVVGAIVGIGIVRDVQTVSTGMLVKIALGWVMTPLFSGLLACLLLLLFM